VEKRICGLVFFFVQAIATISQSIHSRSGATGLHSNVYQKDFADAFSFTGNQALLASKPGFATGIYTERKYLLEELGYVDGVISFSGLAGGIGIQLQYFGFSAYNESSLSISYGRNLGKWVDIGIQFDYHALNTAGYGNAFSINGGVAIILHLSDHLQAALNIYNPGGSQWNGISAEKLAASFKTGCGFEISKEFYLELDLIKEEDQQANIEASLHCQFAKKFFGSFGIEANDFSPYGQAGWAWRKMRIYIAVSHHPQLGYTPGLSFQFGNFFPKK
jgi:hypothetical protein